MSVYKKSFGIIALHCILLLGLTTACKDTSNPIKGVQSHNPEQRVKNLLNNAETYSRSNPNKGIEICNEALTLSLESGVPSLTAEATVKLGELYMYKGEMESALKHYKDGLLMYKTINDTERIADTYNKIGIVYDLMDIYDTALENFNSSYELYKSLNIETGMASVSTNIGIIYIKTGKLAEALKALKDSEDVYRKHGHTENLANTLNNTGLVYFQQEDYSMAEKYMSQAMEVHEKNNRKHGITIGLINLGAVMGKTGRYDTGISYLNKALSMAEEMDNSILIRNTYEELSNIYRAKGDLNTALDYYIKYKNVNDSIVNESINKKIAAIETDYEVTQKEQKIELLEKDNKIQQLIRNSTILFSAFVVLILILMYNRHILRLKLNIEKQKKKDAQEKAKLEKWIIAGKVTSNILHEIRQPVMALNNCIYALKRDNEQSCDCLELMDSEIKYLKSIASRWVDYINPEKYQIKPLNLKEVIHNSIESIQSAFPEEGYTIQVHSENDSVMVPGDPVRIKQVFINLIKNALEEMEFKGEINIELTRENKKIIVCIKDQGPGIDPDIAESLFEPFTSGKSSNNMGLGLSIVAEIIRRHHGTVSISGLEAGGAVVKMTLPELSEECPDCQSE